MAFLINVLGSDFDLDPDKKTQLAARIRLYLETETYISPDAVDVEGARPDATDMEGPCLDARKRAP